MLNPEVLKCHEDLITHLASQASSHLYQSAYTIWKQSDKDFLSYRENDEVSVDATADAADAA